MQYRIIGSLIAVAAVSVVAGCEPIIVPATVAATEVGPQDVYVNRAKQLVDERKASHDFDNNNGNGWNP